MKKPNETISECFNCGSKSIIDLGDDYCFSSPFYGDVSSDEHHVFKCSSCGMILMNYDTRRYLKIKIENIVQDFLMLFHCPYACKDEYLSEEDVKLQIGCFNDEFVMHVTTNGKKLYWKPSVEKYAQFNDGRIKII